MHQERSSATRLRLLEPLGAGGYASVWKAELNAGKGGPPMRVAAKLLKVRADDEAHKDEHDSAFRLFAREVRRRRAYSVTPSCTRDSA